VTNSVTRRAVVEVNLGRRHAQLTEPIALSGWSLMLVDLLVAAVVSMVALASSRRDAVRRHWLRRCGVDDRGRGSGDSNPLIKRWNGLSAVLTCGFAGQFGAYAQELDAAMSISLGSLYVACLTRP
jgi:hypothetical protein